MYIQYFELITDTENTLLWNRRVIHYKTLFNYYVRNGKSFEFLTAYYSTEILSN